MSWIYHNHSDVVKACFLFDFFDVDFKVADINICFIALSVKCNSQHFTKACFDSCLDRGESMRTLCHCTVDREEY